MNKIAIIGDMHFGVKNGHPDFLSFQLYWFEECLKKLQEMGITIIYQTGDLFDTRSHMRLNVMHAMITRFPELLEKYGIKKVIIIGGNHDMFYRDINNICSLELIQLLNDRKGFTTEFSIYTDDVGVLKIGDKTLNFVPWLNKNNQTRLLNEVSQNKADYLFGHFEMVGMPMIPGVLCEHGVEVDQFKDHKRVISGHFHTVSESKNCTMVGTPYHITWNDVQDGNNRGFWILDVDTNELTLHKNEDHMTLFSVIKYDPTYAYDDEYFAPYEGTIAKILVSENPDPKHYKKFRALLNDVKFIDYNTIDTTMVIADKVEISEEVLSLDTLSAIRTYIDMQGDGFEKDSVKTLAEEIFMEVSTDVKQINS